MGAIDTEAKAYLSAPDKVADAFNYWMYGGRKIIKPDELKELDTTTVVLPFGNTAKQPLQKVRDVLKLYTAMRDNQVCYLILGLEVQSTIHYAMPVRNMLYDAMGYAQQVSNLIAKNKADGVKLTGAEYLSGMRKEDKLMPIITLVISLSTENWNGPTSIHEMLFVKNKEILNFVPNYKLNILSPAKIKEEDFCKFNTELGMVLECIKHKKDKDMNWMKKNNKFTKVTRSTASFIKTVTGFNISLDEKGDVVNMWNAWENGLNQARNDGYIAGEISGRQVGISEGETNMMTAIRMIKENKASEVICETTGLSNKRLSELRSML